MHALSGSVTIVYECGCVLAAHVTFFRPVLTSCNLVPVASFLFDVNVKKYKDAGDEFGRNAFAQRLRVFF